MEGDIFYKIQYAIEFISFDPRLIRVWVRHLPKIINYLNNYPTYFIRESDSSKWRLVLLEVILLEEVESKPSILLKWPIDKDKITLKKDDSVRYLFTNAKWEGEIEAVYRSTDPIWLPFIHKIRKIVISKNEPILYYLEGDEFSLK